MPYKLKLPLISPEELNILRFVYAATVVLEKAVVTDLKDAPLPQPKIEEPMTYETLFVKPDKMICPNTESLVVIEVVERVIAA